LEADHLKERGLNHRKLAWRDAKGSRNGDLEQDSWEVVEASNAAGLRSSTKNGNDRTSTGNDVGQIFTIGAQ